MTLSPVTRRLGVAGLAFLAASLVGYESSSRADRWLTPRPDLAGVLTVCDGITGRDVIPGRRYTQAECDALLVKSIDSHAARALPCIHVPIGVPTMVGLAHFAYNIGPAAFCASTVARLINAGNLAAGCAQITDRWVFVTINGRKVDCRTAGDTCPGVVTRRAHERALCESRIQIPGLFAGATGGATTGAPT